MLDRRDPALRYLRTNWGRYLILGSKNSQNYSFFIFKRIFMMPESHQYLDLPNSFSKDCFHKHWNFDFKTSDPVKVLAAFPERPQAPVPKRPATSHLPIPEVIAFCGRARLSVHGGIPPRASACSKPFALILEPCLALSGWHLPLGYPTKPRICRRFGLYLSNVVTAEFDAC